MYLLADNYARLLDSPVPPGVSRSKYLARLATLAVFTERAADDCDTRPTDAIAR